MVDSYTDFLLPPFAKYLKKYLKVWKRSDAGGVVMIPRTGVNYDSVLIRSARLPWSADKTWFFIASIVMIDTDVFTAENIVTYQKLKGHECEIRKLGFRKRSIEFISSPILSHLKTEMPELKIQNYLSTYLQENNRIIELITDINPDSLTIKLFNPPIETKDLNAYINVYKKIFMAPTEIIWNISLEKYLGDILTKNKYTKMLDSIIELLDIIAEICRKTTRRVMIL